MTRYSYRISLRNENQEMKLKKRATLPNLSQITLVKQRTKATFSETWERQRLSKWVSSGFTPKLSLLLHVGNINSKQIVRLCRVTDKRWLYSGSQTLMIIEISIIHMRICPSDYNILCHVNVAWRQQLCVKGLGTLARNSQFTDFKKYQETKQNGLVFEIEPA